MPPGINSYSHLAPLALLHLLFPFLLLFFFSVFKNSDIISSFYVSQ